MRVYSLCVHVCSGARLQLRERSGSAGDTHADHTVDTRQQSLLRALICYQNSRQGGLLVNTPLGVCVRACVHTARRQCLQLSGVHASWC